MELKLNDNVSFENGVIIIRDRGTNFRIRLNDNLWEDGIHVSTEDGSIYVKPSCSNSVVLFSGD